VEAHTSAIHTTNIDAAADKASAEAVIAEELGHGMDRTMDNIGTHDEMAVYEHTASGYEAFLVVQAHLRSMQEMLIRLGNPSELLLVQNNPYVNVKLGIGNTTLANNIHLDYMERHMDISGLDYNVISMQDIETASFTKTYDMAVVQMPLVRHDLGLIEKIYSQLPSGGSIIIIASNDHGKFFAFNLAHDYSAAYDSLKALSGAHLYHTASGFGVSLLTKTT
jgi:hypothetical protein